MLELFGGIGACTKALKNIGMNVDVVDYVEIDKYACKSYNAINGTNFEPQDIKEWDKDINVDLIMHGSPCQDFSVSGLQMGGDEGSGTRSSLMYESIRIINKLKPKYVVWENVKNLLSKKHKHNFDNYINKLDELGYNSYYQVLNAKDYGIPQNRERVYTVSIRKDIDNENFVFPNKEDLVLRLKDMLEDKVDEKYYLSDDKVSKIEKSNFIQEKKRIQDKEYSDTILARDYKDPKCVRVGGIFDTEKSKHQAGSIYDKEGLAPTLDAMQGGWRQPSIVEDKLPGAYGRNFGSKGKIQDIKGHDCVKRVYSGEGLAPTLTDMQGGNRQPKIMIVGNYMPSGHDASRIVDEEGIAPTVKENHGTVTAVAIRGKYNEPVIAASRGRNPDRPGDRTPGIPTEQRLEINKQGISNTITTVQKDNYVIEPCLKIKEATKAGYKEAYAGDGVNISGRMKYQRGNVQKEMTQTLMANGSERGVVTPDMRIRKLTPRECWRLMGFGDEDFYKAESTGNSNSQLYKQAGNSIVVKVLEKIFKNLLTLN